MNRLLLCTKKYIRKWLTKIRSPLLLSASIIIVIKVLETLWPESFASLPIRILKITLFSISSYLMGYTVGRLEIAHRFADRIFLTVLLTIALFYVTPSLMNAALGIILATVAWTLALYWLVINTVHFIGEINKVSIPQKGNFIHMAKSLAELLTFVVAVLELLNLVIPLLIQ